jgi:uncharacterized protein YqeY
MIEKQLEQDIKTAMLARDSETTEVLRGLKSALLYYKVANSKRDQELDNQEIISVLSKESKKRQESADLYVQGGNQDRADKELSEKKIIDKYLPAKMSLDELSKVVDQIVSENQDSNMGQIIGMVRAKTQGAADGGDIAKLVKEKIG